MKHLSVLCALALVLAACSTTPSGHFEEKDLKVLFVEADQNRDGKVTRDEFIDFMIVQAFEHADKNRDGKIVRTEFGGDTAAFESLDAGDGSGSFTLAEALANPVARKHMAIPFDEADTNGSGAITWDEFVASRERARAYTW